MIPGYLSGGSGAWHLEVKWPNPPAEAGASTEIRNKAAVVEYLALVQAFVNVLTIKTTLYVKYFHFKDKKLMLSEVNVLVTELLNPGLSHPPSSRFPHNNPAHLQ